MKYLLLLCASCMLLSAHAEVVMKPKKERMFDGYEKEKHHRNKKKIAADVASGVATAGGQIAIKEVKKSRARDKSSFDN